jgi:hypothetical protein
MAGYLTSQQNRRSASRFWSRLSDEELLTTNFHADNPEMLENLLDSPPGGDEVPEIEFTYDTTFSGMGMVRCVRCKKKARNHNKGFVLQFLDGRRMLIGKDCGEKLYGATFHFVKADFTEAVNRKEALVHRASVLKNKTTICDLFDALAGAECWRTYSDVKRDFNSSMSELSADLAKAVARQDGALSSEQKVRDTLAEAEYETRTGRKTKIFRTVVSTAWHLQGQSFFAPKPLPNKLVLDLVRRAKAAVWKLGDPAPSTSELRQFFGGIRNIVEELKAQCSRVDDLVHVFSPTQIAAISDWLQSRSLGSLQREGNRLFRANKSGVRVKYRDDRWYGEREEIILPGAFPKGPHQLLSEIQVLLATPIP